MFNGKMILIHSRENHKQQLHSDYNFQNIVFQFWFVYLYFTNFKNMLN